MTITAPIYRLTCRCGAAVPVNPGQAGGVARCPACGGGVDVPRLRDLAAVAEAEPEGGGARPDPWGRCQAGLFLGLVIAVVAAAAAFLVPRLEIGGPALIPDEAMIRAVVESSDLPTILQVWAGFRDSGVDRGAMPEELRLQRVAGLAGWISGLCWAVSGLGGVLALASGVAWVTSAGGQSAGGRPA